MMIISRMVESDIEAASRLLSADDVDAELRELVNSDRSNLYAAYSDKVMVAVAQFVQKFIYVYVAKEHRRKGIGTEVARYGENAARTNGAGFLITTYRTSDDGARAFAERLSYVRRYSSACMKYFGEKYDTSDMAELVVREYRDEDYDTAHALYANAFHQMRVRVGDFPNSTVEQPSDEMKRDWAETCNERFVCVRDGKVVGYSHVERNEISSIAVAPELQRQGIGRRFFKYMCNKLMDECGTPVVLFCVVGNDAKTLYKELGFVDEYVADYAIKKF